LKERDLSREEGTVQKPRDEGVFEQRCEEAHCVRRPRMVEEERRREEEREEKLLKRRQTRWLAIVNVVVAGRWDGGKQTEFVDD
jgi:hypothetical protein